jgi:hypothetical protein
MVEAAGAPVALAGELARLSDDELTVGYDRAVVGVRRAQWCRLALAAEVERRRMWKTDGVGSLRSWVCMRSGEGDRAAFGEALVARGLGGLPLVSVALREGRLCFDQVRLLVVLAGLTGVGDAELVVLGERHTVPQLETLCRAARRLGRVGEREGHARRFLRWWVDDDGTFHVRGRLHGVDGLTVTSVLSQMASEAPKDPASGLYEAFDARCADALVELCADGGSGPWERATVVVHAPIEALAPAGTVDRPDPTGAAGPADPTGPSGPAGPGVSGVSWEGTVVAGDTLWRLLCDCRLRVTVDDVAGRGVGIGRRSRSVPGWLAAQVRWRDGGCRFPGCERTRLLHSHHVEFWGAGGRTDLGNLATLCGVHHRMVHEGGWGVVGDPDGELVFVSPGGSRFASRPAPRVGSLPGRRRSQRVIRHRPGSSPGAPNAP